ncbi:NapC/NirT family cytochrome c [bacterium]|nr:NapC/NirT family cytochrome c [bacterium]
MGEDPVAPSTRRPSLLQNWISAFGLILTASSFFAVICLLAIDFFAHASNPYLGILTYFVAPFFLILGLVFVFVGVSLERRRLVQRAAGVLALFPIIDLNSGRHRKLLGSLLGFGALFFLITAIGSYRSYHFTESTQFCGQVCHKVMNPEFTAYQNSPHARVTCTQCHIGPGATWFVRSKLSGTYQVYATLANKYPRPIPTPIKNLRPAQDTCEQCHWPQKFYGSVERVNYHYLADETNTPWTIRLLMKVGGGDPSFGPVGGIHWHMNIGSKVEYIATDKAREQIAWVRFVDPTGQTTVYHHAENRLTPEQVAGAELRTMDCMDCHNRPSHIYYPPNRSVNIAMSAGRIDPAIPYIKQQAVEVLTQEYPSTATALEQIATALTGYYATNHPDYSRAHPQQVPQAVAAVQQIYRNNFFPEMKVNWRVYPNHIGHTMFEGCFRCHSGLLRSAEGVPISRECNSCHTIIAQGTGERLERISPQGLEFEHPVDIGEMWKEMECYECHTGALVQ